MPCQLDEVGRDDRGVELQRFDSGILLPIQPFAFNPVGKAVARFRRLFPGGINVAEINLALHFPGVQRNFFVAERLFFSVAAEPYFKYSGKICAEVHKYVVALLRAGDHMREKDHLLQRKRPVARLGFCAAVFGKRQLTFIRKFVAQDRAVVRHDLQGFSGEDIRECGCGRRPLIRRFELFRNLIRRQFRVFKSVHRYIHLIASYEPPRIFGRAVCLSDATITDSSNQSNCRNKALPRSIQPPSDAQSLIRPIGIAPPVMPLFILP